MGAALKGMPQKGWAMPSGIISEQIDPNTGARVTESVIDTVFGTPTPSITEYFYQEFPPPDAPTGGWNTEAEHAGNPEQIAAEPGNAIPVPPNKPAQPFFPSFAVPTPEPTPRPAPAAAGTSPAATGSPAPITPHAGATPPVKAPMAAPATAPSVAPVTTPKVVPPPPVKPVPATPPKPAPAKAPVTVGTPI